MSKDAETDKGREIETAVETDVTGTMPGEMMERAAATIRTMEHAAAAVRTVSWTVQKTDCSSVKPAQEQDGFIKERKNRNRGPQLTIEQFLRDKGCSHHVLTHLKHTDHGILKNGEWAYANQPLSTGDVITVRVEETENSDRISAVSLPISVVYEDEDVLVVDKPGDMPVHPSMGNYENTLANAVMYYYASQKQAFTFRCITRLDRDTTGLVLIAKNALSGAILSSYSSKRQIHREYLAITDGILPEEGTIDAPIARCPGSALMRCVDWEHGERAVTHYQRLGVYRMPYETSEETFQGGNLSGLKSDAVSVGCAPQEISLANVRLETGRTHQIRVHMKSIGHPLPGDFLYNPESVCNLAPRQMLHAHRLAFAHPITGEPLVFESKMPPDMRRLLEIYQKLKTK
ncbi:MAG: RluA family pseudouridine synthase [Lachnospiraceae bacterium]|nr:RluA family pseudouridine synthase [Lachnospiraceae bacterium]